ncbi:peptide chain release factor 2 [Desulfonauticus submarinus]|uniref:peptide chain release factor 2 n=1 Tax=Desulfonauticus submarinus TaxID=206665 RepID=UPI00190E71B1|nr:peptide chain release factor 2 [Desulfonauticus submarinus]
MLDLNELKISSIDTINKLDELWRRLDLKVKEKELAEIEKKLSDASLWSNHEKVTPLLQRKRELENILEKIKNLYSKKEDLLVWLALVEEGESECLQEAEKTLRFLKESLEILEMELLLSGEGDDAEAILEIHPGAGGIEAQDWAEMLLRMYTRWAERHSFKIEYLDYIGGEEAGIKSVTLHVKGTYSYGFLKGEKGTHRLIRISPFDASKRRHTSFASVDVYPYEREDIKIEIKEEDLEIEAFRAGGPGGQHVNKTSSAIRIIHKPTGLVVQSQNERSQFQNKEIALKILKAKLLQMELAKRQEKKQESYEAKTQISFGHQIRTYTLHPYRLVKDHRTGYETSNVEDVLDGNIDIFIKEYLIFLNSGTRDNGNN